MNNSTIIFAKAETLLNQKTCDIVSEISRSSNTKIAISLTELETNGLRGTYPEAYFFPVDLDRPVELQQMVKGLHENLSFVIFDLEFKSCAMSYRYPLNWIHTSEYLPERLPAIEVIHRSSFVVGPSFLTQEFEIQPNRFIDIADLDVGDLDALNNSEPRNSNRKLHTLLLAEMTRNEELYGPGLEQLGDDIPLWLQDNIAYRLIPESDRQIPNRVTEGTDAVQKFTEFVINEVQKIKPAKGLIDYNSTDFTSAVFREKKLNRAVGQQAIDMFLSSIEELSDRELEESKEMLLDFIDWERISLGVLIDFTEKVELPSSFYLDLSHSPKVNASILGSYRIQQINHRLGSEVDLDKLDSIINKIDHSAIDTVLWLQGLKIWENISSQKWDPLSENPAIQIELEADDRRLPIEIAALNTQAHNFFYNGSYSASLNHFRRVRAVSKKNRQFSTELASRLNIGKVLVAQGHPKEVWEPYIASVLNEIGPSDSLLQLRFLLKELQLEIEETKLSPIKKGVRKIFRNLQRPSLISVRIIWLTKIVRRLFRFILRSLGIGKRVT